RIELEVFTTTLAHNLDYKDELKSLLHQSFNYLPDFDVYIDFYPLFDNENTPNNHLLICDGRVIGHIGFLEKKLCFQAQEFPICLIGGIAIDSAFQGKGLFKKFFSPLIEKYREKSSLLILWSELQDIYLKNG